LQQQHTSRAQQTNPAVHHQGTMQQQLLHSRACGTVLVLLAAAAACVAASSIQPAPSIKMKVKQVSMDDMPKATNPYAGKPYAGCEGGYCASADFKLEGEFWHAAGSGDAKAVKKLLADEAVNITRNIVPDSEGFARVVDVAVWAASSNGHVDVMKVSACANCSVSKQLHPAYKQANMQRASTAAVVPLLTVVSAGSSASAYNMWNAAATCCRCCRTLSEQHPRGEHLHS
jgi:hypothetical protein